MRSFIILAFCCSFAYSGRAQKAIENQLILRLSSSADIGRISNRGSNFYQMKSLSEDLHIYLLEKSEKFTKEVIDDLKKQYPSAISINYNYELETRSTPNDPLYKDQWALEFSKINKVWDVTTGGKSKSKKDIVIGILDNGIDINHQDLVDNIFVNKGEVANDGRDNDNNGYLDDISGFNVDTRNVGGELECEDTASAWCK